jgi:dolichol-phosphate mannosyltransferase
MEMSQKQTISHAFPLWASPQVSRFAKFCLVGGSGVVVDMGVLFVLADPRGLGLGVTLSKVLAAETALANNFLWNELWTFRPEGNVPANHRGWPRRFLLFNLICSLGIGLAVLLLHFFHSWLGWNLYLSNLVTIILVSVWNYTLNIKFSWRNNQ